MIHLTNEHLIVKDVILNRFNSPKAETVDAKVSDFDDSVFQVQVTPEQKDTLRVSASVRGADKVIAKFGSVLQDIYGSYLQPTPDAGFHVTLVVDLLSLPASKEEKEKLANKLAQIKRNIFGAPFISLSKSLLSGNLSKETFSLEFRLGEFVHFIPSDDRVIVVYDISFKDPTDLAIARIFLQEFNEVRRVKEVAAAPIPNFSPNTPQDLLDRPELLQTVKENSSRAGFLAFAFTKRHMENGKIENSTDHIIQFRAYIHYHVKCSKSQMHSRMRARVNSLLEVLNRAVPEIPKDKKEKKTFSGRTFVVQTGGAVGL